MIIYDFEVENGQYPNCTCVCVCGVAYHSMKSTVIYIKLCLSVIFAQFSSHNHNLIHSFNCFERALQRIDRAEQSEVHIKWYTSQIEMGNCQY